MIRPVLPHPSETAALALIADGAPLAAALECLATLAEATIAGGRAVVLVADESSSGEILRLGAAPSFPPEFGWAFDGLGVDPTGGPCAAAAFRQRPVVAHDLATEVRRPEHRAATMQGLETCWAVPVHSTKTPGVLGVLGLFFNDRVEPGPGELDAVNRVAQLIAVAIAHSRAEVELARRTSHDTLTGLPGRTGLLDRLAIALSRSQRLSSAVAVLAVDLDRFKSINDSLGHDAGDAVLVAVAERLVRAMRPGDTVARFGSDEFTVLCEDVSGRHQAEGIARRLAEVIARPYAVRGREVFLTSSIGIAIGLGKEPPELLVRDASAATQRAKEKGRSRVELFDEELGARVLARLETENALRRAVERREFTLHYQPEVRIDDGAIVGVEALARWSHPELGLIQPVDFIPLAEENGLIVPIGAQVMNEAFRQAAEWQELLGSRPFTVWINLSGRQLAAPDLVDQVEAALAASGVRPEGIGLEMTESVVMEDAESVMAHLRHLKRLGIRLAIDDFGTGYSSLGYLKRFPIDLLKVDRSFVQGLGRDHEDASIVAAIIGLAHILGMDVVAEGVESAVQAEALESLGCFLAQGFFFASPAPPDEITELLRRV